MRYCLKANEFDSEREYPLKDFAAIFNINETICADLNVIYGAVNLEDAEFAREEFREKWDRQYTTHGSEVQPLEFSGGVTSLSTMLGCGDRDASTWWEGFTFATLYV